jgi:DNA repair exonuclease SbcCD ATPase subunit
MTTENKLIDRRNELVKEIKLLKKELKSEQYYTNKYIKRLHDAEEEINQLKKQLAEERAKQLEVDEPCPARTRQEYCDILKGSCDGFPHMWEKCPRKQEKLDAARQQLHMEGAGFATK